MIFELRQYRIKNGMRDQWVKVMEEEVIPFQCGKGMIIVASFTAINEEDLYVWIRRFDDEKERDRQYKEVYESKYWKENIAPKAKEMLDKDSMKVIMMEATPKSIMR